MKKAFAIILTLVLLLSLAIGCSNNESSSNDTPDESTEISKSNDDSTEIGRIKDPSNNTEIGRTGDNEFTRESNDVTPPDEEIIEWWQGSYYGILRFPDASEPWSGIIGYVGDIYAVIEVEENGLASIYLWDDSEEVGTIIVQIDPHGDALVIDVEILGWPGEFKEPHIMTSADTTYQDMIEINHRFIDLDGDWFDFTIYLRKWGMDWDDVSDEDKPPYYFDWYLRVMEYPMLEVLRELEVMHHSKVD